MDPRGNEAVFGFAEREEGDPQQGGEGALASGGGRRPVRGRASTRPLCIPSSFNSYSREASLRWPTGGRRALPEEGRRGHLHAEGLDRRNGLDRAERLVPRRSALWRKVAAHARRPRPRIWDRLRRWKRRTRAVFHPRDSELAASLLFQGERPGRPDIRTASPLPGRPDT